MTAFSPSRVRLLALATLLLPVAWLTAQTPTRSDNLRVTIVTVAASDRHKNVPPKLSELAREVQKRESGLTGFRVDRTTSQPVAVGNKENFPILEDRSASVDITVLQKDDATKRIRLAVKAPQVGEITYATCYDKFFPILTRVFTKDRERLVIAIMVKAAD